MNNFSRLTLLGSTFSLMAACAGSSGATSSSSSSSSGGTVTPTLAIKAHISTQLDALHAAALAIQAAAPAPDANGWNATDDAAAVAAMRARWKDARVAYERVEGAIAVLFPEYDASTDERYDGFISEAPDTNLFDGQGATGVHALERILWAGEHPAAVVAFESSLPNYEAAAFPSSLEQATQFKTGLCQRLVDDTAAMKDAFAPLALEPETAFRGVVGSIIEQHEKVNLASTAEDESRYAQHTMADMRANLQGGESTFEAFRTVLSARPNGPALVEKVDAAFARINGGYAAVTGEAIPPLPEGWNASAPTPAMLDTPYGRLFNLLATEVDPAHEGSLVHSMDAAAVALDIPQLP